MNLIRAFVLLSDFSRNFPRPETGFRLKSTVYFTIFSTNGDRSPHTVLSALGFCLLSTTRWVNLWWTADFAEDFGWGGCVLSAGQGDLGASVFVGNLALVVVALVGIFLLHVAVISGVEALWLAKVSLVNPLST